ncbi:MAG: hypothetical protein AB7U38_11885 [Hyphomicrobiales bacterium]
MGLPKIVMDGRLVVLLSGFRIEPGRGYRPRGHVAGDAAAGAPLAIDASDKLRQAVRRNPDAVAFGYVVGEWVAGA